MRAVIVGLAGFFVVSDAMAADYLRGSTYEGGPSTYSWAGVYVGAQIGYSQVEASLDPIGRTAPDRITRPTIETDAALSQWPGLPGRDARASSYGGFVGYNSQWGEVVLGLELNYSHSSLHTPMASSVVFDTSLLTGVAGTLGQADYLTDVRITDYGTARLRAGYAWNWVMPYGMFGLAVGRADIMRSATVSYTGGAPAGYFPYTDVQNRTGAFTFGYMAGLGVDIGLLPGVFVRGEYEFVQFNTIEGLSARLNTFRVAAAFKF